MRIILIAAVLWSGTAHALNKEAIKAAIAMTTLRNIKQIIEVSRSPVAAIKIIGDGYGIKCQTFKVEQSTSLLYSAVLVDQSNKEEECHD